jgi:hypothetical protein
MKLPMNGSKLRDHIVADIARGLRQSPEDLAVAALVMASFALAPVLVANAMAWWPPFAMIVLFLALAVPATLWNAGWRARTAKEDSAGA